MRNKKLVLGILGGLIILAIIIFILLNSCEKKVEYEVSFDTNGGSGINSVMIMENELLSKPEDPVKEGYEFEGWYLNNELFDFNTKITKNIKLEARWKEKEAEAGIVLSAESITLAPDKSTTLEITLSNLESSDLSWSTSDSKIAKVDQNGKITAIKEGKATITVSTSDGKYQATCEVTVSDEIVKVESVNISGNSSVTVGKTIRLSANIKPSDASNKNVTWKSSNTSIATVSSNGTVKGIKVGTVTITVTTKDGNKEATYKVTVKEAQKEDEPVVNTNKTVKVKSVSISGSDSVNVGDTIKLSAKIKPSDASNKNVTWKSSNTSIATVDSKGTVKGIKEGTVTITVTTKDGNKTSTHKVTVKKVSKPSEPTESKDVVSITITGKTEMYIGDTLSLGITFNPSNATNKNVTWKITSGSDNATITQNGVVTAKKAGTVTVTATSANGKSDTHTITIKEKESVYKVVLTPLKQANGSIVQYEITSVLCDNKTFGDYNYISIDSTRINKGKTTMPKSLVEDKNGNITLKSVKIVLNDGKTVTASVGYNNAKNVD